MLSLLRQPLLRRSFTTCCQCPEKGNKLSITMKVSYINLFVNVGLTSVVIKCLTIIDERQQNYQKILEDKLEKIEKK